jgi:ubiquinol-cytochrome c reductase cytochrome b subunit
VLTKGINEYPVPGQEVRKETYRDEYVPFDPKAIGKDLVFSALVVLGILFCCLCS